MVGSGVSGDCEEQRRLRGVWSAASLRLSEAVTLLAKNAGSLPWYEYEDFRVAAEQSRLEAEAARLTLERHRAEHHC
jgi:hypothetical protein